MTSGGRLGGNKAALTPVSRRRRRWVIACGIAAAWLALYVVVGSAFSATIVLAVFAAAGAIAVLGMRSMGVTADHPWIRRLATRPWRDGPGVLRVALGHLHDVFVITPSGSLLAPSRVEIQMNPEDLVSLCDQMELGLIAASATEAYQEQAGRHGARFATAGPPEVYVVADERIPRGRYRLRQGRSAAATAWREMPDAGYDLSYAPELAYAVPQHAEGDPDGRAWSEPHPARTAIDARTGVDAGPATVMEQTLAPVPVLRLVTGDSVAQTRTPGARAGRGRVELVLPNVPTVSREHARFGCSDGRWRVTNLGVNGLSVNGAPATTEHPLSDGDIIRWGSRPDALVSRVEIG
jgi:hypothetical protein